ncbi:hypothetical protein [Candidatus Frankia nodulisporulans]|uniref:hypothetical protein n=1 Tax=Candidatus Frankia nodulisporulans TaxID=2060052 RepID=UPI0013CFE94E|nr:hypothetical protein [Candidatus Frankia nodulisporulans]
MPTVAMALALLAVMVMVTGIVGTVRGHLDRLRIPDRRHGLIVATIGFTVAVVAFGFAAPLGVHPDTDDDASLWAAGDPRNQLGFEATGRGGALGGTGSAGSTAGPDAGHPGGPGGNGVELAPPVPTLPPYPDPIYGLTPSAPPSIVDGGSAQSAIPAVPGLPAVPAVPAVPAQPAVPAVPSAAPSLVRPGTVAPGLAVPAWPVAPTIPVDGLTGTVPPTPPAWPGAVELPRPPGPLGLGLPDRRADLTP